MQKLRVDFKLILSAYRNRTRFINLFIYLITTNYSLSFEQDHNLYKVYTTFKFSIKSVFSFYI